MHKKNSNQFSADGYVHRRVGTSTFCVIEGRLCGVHIKSDATFMLSVLQDPMILHVGMFRWRSLCGGATKDGMASNATNPAVYAKAFLEAFDRTAAVTARDPLAVFAQYEVEGASDGEDGGDEEGVAKPTTTGPAVGSFGSRSASFKNNNNSQSLHQSGGLLDVRVHGTDMNDSTFEQESSKLEVSPSQEALQQQQQDGPHAKPNNIRSPPTSSSSFPVKEVEDLSVGVRLVLGVKKDNMVPPPPPQSTAHHKAATAVAQPTGGVPAGHSPATTAVQSSAPGSPKSARRATANFTKGPTGAGQDVDEAGREAHDNDEDEGASSSPADRPLTKRRSAGKLGTSAGSPNAADLARRSSLVAVHRQKLDIEHRLRNPTNAPSSSPPADLTAAAGASSSSAPNVSYSTQLPEEPPGMQQEQLLNTAYESITVSLRCIFEVYGVAHRVTLRLKPCPMDPLVRNPLLWSITMELYRGLAKQEVRADLLQITTERMTQHRLQFGASSSGGGGGGGEGSHAGVASHETDEPNSQRARMSFAKGPQAPHSGPSRRTFETGPSKSNNNHSPHHQGSSSLAQHHPTKQFIVSEAATAQRARETERAGSASYGMESVRRGSGVRRLPQPPSFASIQQASSPKKLIKEVSTGSDATSDAGGPTTTTTSVAEGGTSPNKKRDPHTASSTTTTVVEELLLSKAQATPRWQYSKRTTPASLAHTFPAVSTTTTGTATGSGGGGTGIPADHKTSSSFASPRPMSTKGRPPPALLSNGGFDLFAEDLVLNHHHHHHHHHRDGDGKTERPTTASTTHGTVIAGSPGSPRLLVEPPPPPQQQNNSVKLLNNAHRPRTARLDYSLRTELHSLYVQKIAEKEQQQQQQLPRAASARVVHHGSGSGSGAVPHAPPPPSAAQIRGTYASRETCPMPSQLLQL